MSMFPNSLSRNAVKQQGRHTLASNCPFTSWTPSCATPSLNLYLEKNLRPYLKQQYAESEELVALKERCSGFADMTTSSPYLDRHVSALMNAGTE
jgi:hypothetical protein